ncbi:MAG: diacylglycerol kinase family protein [Lewinellaceae bacterium]|nr:diacylglycerol kinase family protein [Lewinella sp.]MCB9277578.1 diacylglycerol kinase family protein [Lewinellaceae bacterium]
MIRKRLLSFKYAFRGIADLFVSQPNARIHAAAAVAVIAAGWYFRISAGEWALVALTIAVVLAAEAFNSALEYLTDLASPEFHPLAGKAKDIAAAAVLLAALGAAAVGALVFGPRILEHWG